MEIYSFVLRGSFIFFLSYKFLKCFITVATFDSSTLILSIWVAFWQYKQKINAFCVPWGVPNYHPFEILLIGGVTGLGQETNGHHFFFLKCHWNDNITHDLQPCFHMSLKSLHSILGCYINLASDRPWNWGELTVDIDFLIIEVHQWGEEWKMLVREVEKRILMVPSYAFSVSSKFLSCTEAVSFLCIIIGWRSWGFHQWGFLILWDQWYQCWLMVCLAPWMLPVWEKTQERRPRGSLVQGPWLQQWRL